MTCEGSTVTSIAETKTEFNTNKGHNSNIESEIFKIKKSRILDFKIKTSGKQIFKNGDDDAFYECHLGRSVIAFVSVGKSKHDPMAFSTS